MSNDPFTAPASSSGIKWDDLKGHLLLVTVHSVEHEMMTSFGPTDAIRADVTDLDTGDEHTDTLIFPRVLQGQLRSAAGGGKVLGRLGQGNAKPGQSAPWKLDDPTDKDKAAARAWIDQHTGAPF